MRRRTSRTRRHEPNADDCLEIGQSSDFRGVKQPSVTTEVFGQVPGILFSEQSLLRTAWRHAFCMSSSSSCRSCRLSPLSPAEEEFHVQFKVLSKCVLRQMRIAHGHAQKAHGRTDQQLARLERDLRRVRIGGLQDPPQDSRRLSYQCAADC